MKTNNLNIGNIRAALLASQREDRKADRDIREHFMNVRLDARREAAMLTEASTLLDLRAQSRKAIYDVVGGGVGLAQAEVGKIIGAAGSLQAVGPREEAAAIKRMVADVEEVGIRAQLRGKDAEHRLDGARQRGKQVLETIRSIAKERREVLAAVTRS